MWTLIKNTNEFLCTSLIGNTSLLNTCGDSLSNGQSQLKVFIACDPSWGRALMNNNMVQKVEKKNNYKEKRKTASKREHKQIHKLYSIWINLQLTYGKETTLKCIAIPLFWCHIKGRKALFWVEAHPVREKPGYIYCICNFSKVITTLDKLIR